MLILTWSLGKARQPRVGVAPGVVAGAVQRDDRAGMARHMARAVVTLVRWDNSTGVPPQRSAIAKACEAGLDLYTERKSVWVDLS